MPVFKLTPIDLDDPNWKCSMHSRPCLVRAEDEDQAREFATVEFKIGVGRNRELKVRKSPWKDSDLVECTETADLTPELGRSAEGVVLIERGTWNR